MKLKLLLLSLTISYLAYLLRTFISSAIQINNEVCVQQGEGERQERGKRGERREGKEEREEDIVLIFLMRLQPRHHLR